MVKNLLRILKLSLPQQLSAVKDTPPGAKAT
jgi:hypothetical protein